MAQRRELEGKRRVVKDQVRIDSIDYLRKRAELIEKSIRGHTALSPNSCILEIGGDGRPFIDFLSIGEKHSLDPLEKDCHELFRNILASDVNRITAMAEKLPYKDNTFDAIILLNVIDHCMYPEQLVQETGRVMKDSGIILLSVNTTSRTFCLLKRIRSTFVKSDNDIMHPHAFSSLDVANLMKNSFVPLSIHKTYIDDLSGNPPSYHVGIPKNMRGILADRGRIYFIGRKL